MDGRPLRARYAAVTEVRRGAAVPAVVVSTARGYWLASDARVCHGPVGTGHDVQGLAVAATRVGAVMRVETKLTERMETMDPGPRGRVDSDDSRMREVRAQIFHTDHILSGPDRR